jgi:hypothetical protein
LFRHAGSLLHSSQPLANARGAVPLIVHIVQQCF